jgi:hypothetical protein
MITHVIAYMHLLYFSILAEFTVKVFVEGIEMLLNLLSIEGVSGSMNGILINVATEDGLRVVWLDMFS